MAVIHQVVTLGRDWAQVHDAETTKRAEIAANADVTIAEIHARRDLFLTYLDKSFDERARTFDQLFDRLDKALAGNPELVPSILASISALAHKSPFADLHDPQLLRRMLEDPDHEWTV